MPLREDIIKAARDCLGTPFVHQGRLPGKGLDCVGLVRWPHVALGFGEEDERRYGMAPDPKRMKQLLEHYLVPIPRDQMKPADILWFRIDGMPTHLAIYAGKTIIHALNSGPQRVVEHGFRHPWTQRVAGVFRYKWLHELEE